MRPAREGRENGVEEVLAVVAGGRASMRPAREGRENGGIVIVDVLRNVLQ